MNDDIQKQIAFSVIVPIYNAEKFLRRCVEGLNPEKNRDVEYILVDDGSTDQSPKICDEYSRVYPNVRVFHKPNGGSTSARNYGLANSHGMWIWFVDADDIVLPDAFELLRSCLPYSNAEVIYSPLKFFQREADIAWKAEKVATCQSAEISGLDFLRSTYTGTYGHFNWAYVFSRDLLKRCASKMKRSFDKLYREDIVLYEDVLFCETFLREAQTVLVLPQPIYACGNNPESVTNKRNTHVALSGLAAVRALAQFSPLPGSGDDRASMEIGLLFSVYKLVGTEPAAQSAKREVCEEISNRVANIGWTRLPLKLLVRYALLKTKALDLIIALRDRK